MMIKPDWKIFKAKFSENPQNNFEWLCYLLFCKEFEKYYGIFRHKNQSGIETIPVNVGKEVIGWQARFYESTLSKHKADLINTLIKSKRDYPDLTKIIFYTNEDWGQNHKKNDFKAKVSNSKNNDPQVKVDIETKAIELNLQIEWRTTSFFESPFVAIDNEIIVKHFFSLEKSNQMSISLLLDVPSQNRGNIQELVREFNIKINDTNDAIKNSDGELYLLMEDVKSAIDNNIKPLFKFELDYEKKIMEEVERIRKILTDPTNKNRDKLNNDRSLYSLYQKELRGYKNHKLTLQKSLLYLFTTQNLDYFIRNTNDLIRCFKRTIFQEINPRGMYSGEDDPILCYDDSGAYAVKIYVTNDDREKYLFAREPGHNFAHIQRVREMPRELVLDKVIPKYVNLLSENSQQQQCEENKMLNKLSEWYFNID